MLQNKSDHSGPLKSILFLVLFWGVYFIRGLLMSTVVATSVLCNWQVLVGNRLWMSRNGVSIPEDVERDITNHEQQGQTVVLAAINSE